MEEFIKHHGIEVSCAESSKSVGKITIVIEGLKEKVDLALQEIEFVSEVTRIACIFYVNDTPISLSSIRSSLDLHNSTQCQW